jgi:hypothetical protein
MVISLNPGAALSANPAALGAFRRAAATWETLFSDPIVVTVTADLGTFANEHTIGSASTNLVLRAHDQVRGNMAADAAGSSTLGIAEALPTYGQFIPTMPAGFSYSGQIVLTRANAKALGLSVSNPLTGTDATITFNSAFSFDYDRSDGVTSGQMDFETVAAHEIGHSLGFISWVDGIRGASPGAFPVSPLDLFRFHTGAAPSTLAAFTSAPRELTPGQSAVFSDSIFQWSMSNGIDRQASHWLDTPNQSVYIGLMDPVLGYAMYETPTQADLRAFDLIGYDLAVPEPGTALLLVGGVLLLGRTLSLSRRA